MPLHCMCAILLGDRRYRHLIPRWINGELSLLFWVILSKDENGLIPRLFDARPPRAPRREAMQFPHSQRKPPSAKALRKARNLPPVLIRSF